ncbi:MAG: NADPH-dependent 2,4-dienoyl-CoA reductase, partial [Desulfatitalea sp.]|nr:NADPH-dependent 2,4-dienoyl-CoA reductase [Desulfatitalea sp.]
RGGAGLIITGGIAPNPDGCVTDGGAKLTDDAEVVHHRRMVEAVHAEGTPICLQILHAGRYARHHRAVAPSALQAPINRFQPRALTADQIETQIADFARCARLARQAGYDGVEIMGSEGYLINQFIVRHTNRRDDAWGGSYENRIRFPLAVAARIREAWGPDGIVIFRLSLLDLIADGSTWEEIVHLARRLETVGVSMFNTGIGWHEARIPTIAAIVPRAAFTGVTARLKREVALPVIASNRINTPEVAEQILAQGAADLVSLARPLLADPDFVTKAATGRAQLINTCIACNQACLDRLFTGHGATCLVNPRAGLEHQGPIAPARNALQLAVVGAGPAGLAFAATAARRGHTVHLYEQAARIGGQLNLAAAIPGKQEFEETLRYFQRQLDHLGVRLHLNRRVTAGMLQTAGHHAVVVATGAAPRRIALPGIDHPRVLTYDAVLQGNTAVGARVAIIGAGGIGVDTALYLARDHSAPWRDPPTFMRHWGIDETVRCPGGLSADPLPAGTPPRRVYLLRRSNQKVGARPGTTTGWIDRIELARRQVVILTGVTYQGFDDQGLHITRQGESGCLAVDHVVLCAGQEPRRELADALQARGVPVHLIGSAGQATGFDAHRAISQGVNLALQIG